ncbi:ISAs1 family transposase [Micromonospora coerulea]|uniref:ISAs1 family transposase n=1 Tax=Micromonospora coerulea TaxID=47856 RepID=UPI0031F90DD2
MLGIDADRRPSEAMIRRLLQALDADRLAMVIGAWLATQLPAPPAGTRRAIAVDGKTLRGSPTGDSVAPHVLAAADQATGVVLASTDVDGKTNEITRFAPLLDQLGDLGEVVVTADALHCQRDHVAYLAERGTHWILTVKGNPPNLRTQLAALPWRAVADADRGACRGHGRPRDPHPENCVRLLRDRLPERRPSHPDPTPPPPARPAETLHDRNRLRDHRPARSPSQTGATRRLAPWSLVDREPSPLGQRRPLRRRPIQIRTGSGPQVMAALRNAAISALRLTGVTNIAAATATTPATATDQSPCSASP